jgi:hypothetical protein
MVHESPLARLPFALQVPMAWLLPSLTVHGRAGDAEKAKISYVTSYCKSASNYSAGAEYTFVNSVLLQETPIFGTYDRMCRWPLALCLETSM